MRKRTHHHVLLASVSFALGALGCAVASDSPHESVGEDEAPLSVAAGPGGERPDDDDEAQGLDQCDIACSNDGAVACSATASKPTDEVVCGEADSPYGHFIACSSGTDAGSSSGTVLTCQPGHNVKCFASPLNCNVRCRADGETATCSKSAKSATCTGDNVSETVTCLEGDGD